MKVIKCDKCNGTGRQPLHNIIWIPGYGCVGGISYKCTKCHGTGVLDWIERIVGKKGNINYSESDVEVLEFNDFPWESLTKK